MVRHLCQSDLYAQLAQVLGYFQADEAAADDQGLFGMILGDVGLDGHRVGDVPDSKDLLGGKAGNGRRGGVCAHGQNQGVVGFLIVFSGLEVPDGDGFLLRMDGYRFAVYPDVHTEPAVEALRCLQGQGRAIPDGAAQVIGEPAVGKGNVGPLFYNHNVCVFVQTAQPGRSRSAACHTADNQYFFLAHSKCSLSNDI